MPGRIRSTRALLFQMLSTPGAIWAAMPFWGVSKGQDAHADSESCPEPCSEKPHHPALHCHFPGRLLPAAVTCMASKEAGENADLPQPLSRVTYLVWSLSRVQSSRLPSNPTRSTVNSILSKRTLFSLPNLRKTPFFKSRPQLCHQQRRPWQGAGQGSKP